MTYRCCACGVGDNLYKLVHVRRAEVSEDGQLTFRLLRHCPPCIAATGIIYPDRFVREMVQDTIEQMRQAAVKYSIEDVVSAAKEQDTDGPDTASRAAVR